MTPSVRPPTQVETARKDIRARILRWSLPPGRTFTEGDLAVDLELGKTPVREALNLLVHEGFVAVAPHSGYQVAAITAQDVQDLFELRLAVEPLAAGLAARRGIPQAREALAVTADRLRDRLDLEYAREVLKFPVEEHVYLLIGHMAFTTALAKLGASRHVEETVDYVLSHQLRHLHLAATLAGPDMFTVDQTRLLDAITIGDAATAEALSYAGVAALRDAVVAALGIGELTAAERTDDLGVRLGEKVAPLFTDEQAHG